MRVLITGGVGFIGQHLARSLEGWDCVALDNLHSQIHPDPDAAQAAFPGQVVVGDVADAEAWAALPRVDAIVHLAAETGTAQSMYEGERYTRTNVEGTRQAAAAASRWGVPMLSMSSRAVYGEGRYRELDGRVVFGGDAGSDAVPEDSREDDPHRPVSTYGQTKSDAEAVAVQTARGVPLTIIRPQNVIGRGQSLHNPYTGVLSAFLARLREGRSLSVYGTGEQTRDFVHVSDLVALIRWNLTNPPEADAARVLNCGTGVRTTLNELARYAAQGSPRREALIEHVEVHRAGDIEHACADLTRLRELGAPAPMCSTADAVADFITWGWDRSGMASSAWDHALDELSARGLVS